LQAQGLELFVNGEINEKALEVINPMIERHVGTFVYEWLGRGKGSGAQLSAFTAEVFRGTGPMNNPSNWAQYTGFFHHLGDIVGAHSIFAARDRGQEYFRDWMNAQIIMLNPNFTFDYDMFMHAVGGANATRWDPQYADIFSRQTGILVAQQMQHFADAWLYFYTAVDQTLPKAQRTRAAQQFSNIVRQIAEIAIEHNFPMGQWGQQDGRQQVPSVIESSRPMFNMDMPEIGVQNLMSFYSYLDGRSLERAQAWLRSGPLFREPIFPDLNFDLDHLMSDPLPRGTRPPTPPPAPLAIASISYTRTSAGQVRMTIITGAGVNNVWIQHSGNQWPQATRIAGSTYTQTWEVVFRPTRFAPQQVQVSANRGFFTNGATIAYHDILRPAV